MDVVAEAVSRLGVEDAESIDHGGQKVVLCGVLAGERVAVKVIELPNPDTSGTALLRAKREHEVLADTDSPHVVGVRSELVDIAHDDGHAVAWAEEFVEGADLKALLDPQWSWDDATLMMCHVARGLHEFHERHVVHRDLSPKNVRRRDNGSFVVLDPGYARFLDESTVTRVGQPGTPGHISPEHLTPKRRPEPRSDLFQLGILAYRVLTGQLPFPADAAAAVLDGLRVGTAELRANIPAEASGLVDRLLARRPARRVQSAVHLLDELGCP